MQHKRHFLCFILVGLNVFLSGQVLAGRDTINLTFKTGVVISSDYHDLLEENYDSVIGGYGWITISAGIGWNINSSIRITPGVELLYNGVEDVFGEQVTNTVVLPKLSFRLQPKDIDGFFIALEGFGINPKSGINQIEFESSELGYGVLFGYAFLNNFGIEMGVQNIPVNVSSRSDREEEYDFGGVAIRILVEL